MTTKPSYKVYCMVGAEKWDMEYLKEVLVRRQWDPSYTIVSDIPIKVVTVPEGSIVIVTDTDASDCVYTLDSEFEKTKEDPNHFIIVPFNIYVASVD